MKQPDAIEVIEFPSGRIMAHTRKIVVALAIVFFTSLSLSSAAYIKEDLDFTKGFEGNFELPRTLRGKRHQNEHFELVVAEDDAVKSEDKPSEFQDKRATVEEIKDISLTHEKDEEQDKPAARKEKSNAEVTFEIHV